MLKRHCVIALVLGMLSFTLVPANATVPSGEWLFLDTADDFEAKWKPGGEPSNTLFITDSTQTIGGLSAPKGHYRLYGEAGSKFVMGNAFFSVTPGDWTMEFRAKMASLGTFFPDVDLDNSTHSAYRGFTVGVRFDGTRTFVIGFNRGVLGVTSSAEVYQTLDESILGGNEDGFHVWRIKYSHATQTMEFFKDDVQVAKFTRVPGVASKSDGGLRMFSAPINVYGTIDVTIDYIAFKSE